MVWPIAVNFRSLRLALVLFWSITLTTNNPMIPSGSPRKNNARTIPAITANMS